MSDTAIWVGRALPVKDTYAAKKYWGSSATAKELASEFACANPAHINKVAGPAVLDVQCIDCQAFKLATSRTDAQSALVHPKKYRCDKCDRANRDKKMRDSFEMQKMLAERKEELRWMPYKDYLGTGEWSERRKTVIRRAGFKCQICASDSLLHVHHRTYVNRGVERPEDMVALCAECHDLFHKHGRLAGGGRA